jgi:transposase-like protein
VCIQHDNNVISEQRDVFEKSDSDWEARAAMREAGKDGFAVAGAARRGDRYLPQFKERVVIFAKTHTFLETARKFNVHNTTVSDWVRDYDNKHKPTDEPQAAAPELMDTTSSSSDAASSSAEDQFKEWLLVALADTTVDSITRDSFVLKAEEATAQGAPASDWFTTWLCRLKEETKRERSCSHLHYPPWFKTAVCTFSQRANPFQAAKAFGLSRRTVCVWIKVAADDQNKQILKTKKKKRDGRAVTDSNIDKQLLKA